MKEAQSTRRGKDGGGTGPPSNISRARSALPQLPIRRPESSQSQSQSHSQPATPRLDVPLPWPTKHRPGGIGEELLRQCRKREAARSGFVSSMSAETGLGRSRKPPSAAASRRGSGEKRKHQPSPEQQEVEGVAVVDVAQQTQMEKDEEGEGESERPEKSPRDFEVDVPVRTLGFARPNTSPTSKALGLGEDAFPQSGMRFGYSPNPAAVAVPAVGPLASATLASSVPRQNLGNMSGLPFGGAGPGSSTLPSIGGSLSARLEGPVTTTGLPLTSATSPLAAATEAWPARSLSSPPIQGSGLSFAQTSPLAPLSRPASTRQAGPLDRLASQESMQRTGSASSSCSSPFQRPESQSLSILLGSSSASLGAASPELPAAPGGRNMSPGPGTLGLQLEGWPQSARLSQASPPIASGNSSQRSSASGDCDSNAMKTNTMPMTSSSSIGSAFSMRESTTLPVRTAGLGPALGIESTLFPSSSTSSSPTNINFGTSNSNPLTGGGLPGLPAQGVRGASPPAGVLGLPPSSPFSSPFPSSFSSPYSSSALASTVAMDGLPLGVGASSSGSATGSGGMDSRLPLSSSATTPRVRWKPQFELSASSRVGFALADLQANDTSNSNDETKDPDGETGDIVCEADKEDKEKDEGEVTAEVSREGWAKMRLSGDISSSLICVPLRPRAQDAAADEAGDEHRDESGKGEGERECCVSSLETGGCSKTVLLRSLSLSHCLSRGDSGISLAASSINLEDASQAGGGSVPMSPPLSPLSSEMMAWRARQQRRRTKRPATTPNRTLRALTPSVAPARPGTSGRNLEVTPTQQMSLPLTPRAADTDADADADAAASMLAAGSSAFFDESEAADQDELDDRLATTDEEASSAKAADLAQVLGCNTDEGGEEEEVEREAGDDEGKPDVKVDKVEGLDEAVVENGSQEMLEDVSTDEKQHWEMIIAFPAKPELSAEQHQELRVSVRSSVQFADPIGRLASSQERQWGDIVCRTIDTVGALRSAGALLESGLEQLLEDITNGQEDEADSELWSEHGSRKSEEDQASDSSTGSWGELGQADREGAAVSAGNRRSIVVTSTGNLAQHILVEGLPLSQANGVYTLQSWRKHHGHHTWARYGSPARIVYVGPPGSAATYAAKDRKCYSSGSQGSTEMKSSSLRGQQQQQEECTVATAVTIQSEAEEDEEDEKEGLEAVHRRAVVHTYSGGEDPGSDMDLSHWFGGWVIGLFEDESVTLARCKESHGSQGGIGGTWEVPDEEDRAAWHTDRAISVQQLRSPPETLWTLNSTLEELAGNYTIVDDVEALEFDGRWTFRREDGKVDLRWNAEEHRWVVLTEASPEAARPAFQQMTRGDYLDPSFVLKWGKWHPDKDCEHVPLIFNPGKMPAALLFVSNFRRSGVNGVYSLGSYLNDAKPTWCKERRNSHFALRWHKQPDAIWGVHRCQEAQDYSELSPAASLIIRAPERPSPEVEAKRKREKFPPWEEFGFAALPLHGGERAGDDGNDSKSQEEDEDEEEEEEEEDDDDRDSDSRSEVEDEENGSQAAAGRARSRRRTSSHQGQLEEDTEWHTSHGKIEKVVIASQLFVDILQGGTMQAARGLYDLVATDSQQQQQQQQHLASPLQRGSYVKSTGGFQLQWRPQEVEWCLEGQTSTGEMHTAVLRKDLPDPTFSSLREWESWDALEGTWASDAGIAVCNVPPPPRKVFVSGNHKSHTFYGVYFLRGQRNGRTSFAKESLTVMSSFMRGEIVWGGKRDPRWILTAQPEKGQFHKAWLNDDVPLPTSTSVCDWITDEEEQEEERRKAEEAAAAALRVESFRNPTSGGRPLVRSSWAGPANRSLFGELPQSLGAAGAGAARSGSSDNLGSGSAAAKSGSGPLGTLSSLGLGPLGFAAGRTSLGSRNQTRRSSLDQLESLPNSVLNWENEDDEGEEEDQGPVHIRIAPVGDAPKKLFLCGHGSDVDAVFFLQDDLYDGRASYKNQLGDTRLLWDRAQQKWLVKCDDEPDYGVGVGTVLSLSADIPDPSLWDQRIPWEMPEGANRSCSQPTTFKSEVSEAHEVDDGVLHAIREEDEEDDEAEGHGSKSQNNTNVGDDDDDESEGPPPWIPAPHVQCFEVSSYPSEVFIFAGAIGQITGIYKLDRRYSTPTRPQYKCEKVGLSTPPVLRYLASRRVWIVERVPKVTGRKTTLKTDPEGLNYTLALVNYDAPHPAAVKAPWTVRGTEGDWVSPQSPILCRIVKEPPKKIFLIGPSFAHDEVSGTYVLGKEQHEGRPCYFRALVDDAASLKNSNNNNLSTELGGNDDQRSAKDKSTTGSVMATEDEAAKSSSASSSASSSCAGEDDEECPNRPACAVRYHVHSRQWIVDLNGLSGAASGALRIICDVPDPTELRSVPDVEWLMLDKGTGSWMPQPLFGCYAGEMPPKQIFFTGGPLGIAGVYTFRFRRLFAARCCYKKDGSDWYVWWDPSRSQWSVGRVKHGPEALEVSGKSKMEAGAMASSGEDVVDPTLCSTWNVPASLVKARMRPLQCHQVPSPPKIVVLSWDVETSATGVYFIGPELHKGRCYYVKQSKNLKDDNWTLYFSPESTKWYFNRHGLDSHRRGAYSSSQDLPDPTHVPMGEWMERSSNSRWKTIPFSIVAPVDRAPDRILLRGATTLVDDEWKPCPFNGVYVKEKHRRCDRAIYIKQVGGTWRLRYYPKGSMWIVDSREGEEFQDDGKGLLAAFCDCWHPAAAYNTWKFFNEADGSKKKRPNETRAGNTKGGAVLTGALLKKFTKGPGKKLEKPKTEEDDIDAGSGSGGGSMDAGSVAPSMASKARGSRFSSASSVSGMSTSGRSISGRSQASRGSGGSGRSKASRARSSASGMSGSQGSGSVSSSRAGSEGKAAMAAKAQLATMTNQWISSPEAMATIIGPAPQRLMISPTEPPELAGVYDCVCQDHNGRPAYRLTDGNGNPKVSDGTGSGSKDSTAQEPGAPRLSVAGASAMGAASGSDAFSFSRHGYALWWNPGSVQWVITEYARSWRLNYTTSHPVKDIIMHREHEHAPALLTQCRPGGLAEETGLPVGAELWSINGDSQTWRLWDKGLREFMASLRLPVMLEFKSTDFPTNANTGLLARLQYDSPYPNSVSHPWEVCALGSTWMWPDQPIQCRALERPPKKIRLMGYRRKPQELNTEFEILPQLHEGRPCYSAYNGRLTICWVTAKRRWCVLDAASGGGGGGGSSSSSSSNNNNNNNSGAMTSTASAGSARSFGGGGRRSGGTTFKPGGVVDYRRSPIYAVCWAPHPAAVEAHGGSWETRSSQPKRTTQVVAVGDPISAQEHEELVLASLRQVLEDCGDQSTMMLTPGEGKTRAKLDQAKLKAAVQSLNMVLREARALGLGGPLIRRAAGVKQQLAGWMLLEMVARQTEHPNPTQASWFETLTLIRAYLRQDEADPRAAFEDENGWTAMHFVAAYGVSEYWVFDAAFALMSAKADVDGEDLKGRTPILLAIASGKMDVVRALLRLKSKKAGNTVLEREQTAAKDELFLSVVVSGDMMEIQKMAASGEVDLNTKNKAGMGALHLCAQWNQAQIIELLAYEGADVNLTDKVGATPLHYAAKANAGASAAILLRKGASPNMRNGGGLTAFMLAIESKSNDVLRDFRKHMVPWEDIETILATESYEEAADPTNLLKNRCVQLMGRGFGDPSNDPCNLRRKGAQDRLQLWNQILIKDPMMEARCCILEIRGELLCKELLLPLIQECAKRTLSTAEGVRYKQFLRYVLLSGIMLFAGSEVNQMAQRATHMLEDKLAELYEAVRSQLQRRSDGDGELPELKGRALEIRPDGQSGRGICHHYFAHGPLSWLSPDASKRTLLSALCALVDLEAFPDLGALCQFAMPPQNRKELFLVHSPSQVQNLLQKFWQRVYAFWLSAAAKKAANKLQEIVSDMFQEEAEVKCRFVPCKPLSKIEESSPEALQTCIDTFGASDVSATGHILQSGIVRDIVRCSVVAADADEVLEMVSFFEGLTLVDRDMEVVAIQNDFCLENTERSYKDIKVTLQIHAAKHLHMLVEVKIIHHEYLELRKHLEVVQKILNGGFAQATSGARRGASLAFAGSRRGPDSGVGKTVGGGGSSSLGGGGGRASVRRWAKGVAVYCWVPFAEAIDEGTPQRPPLSAYGREVLERWTEITPRGETQAKVESKLRPDAETLSETSLMQLLAKEPTLKVTNVEIQRLAADLAFGEARLLRDPEDKQLYEVSDVVLLMIMSGDDKSSVLIRETKPLGLFSGPRKATETPGEAGTKVLEEEVPAFLRPHLRVEDFDGHTAWIATDAALAAGPGILDDVSGAIQKFVDAEVAKVQPTGKGEYADNKARNAAAAMARKSALSGAMSSAMAPHRQKEIESGRVPGAIRFFAVKARFKTTTPTPYLVKAQAGLVGL